MYVVLLQVQLDYDAAVFQVQRGYAASYLNSTCNGIQEIAICGIHLKQLKMREL